MREKLFVQMMTFKEVLNMYNTEYEDQDPKRLRQIQEETYLPKGLINAYLDDRLKPSQKKEFEDLVGNHEQLQEQLRQRVEKKNFVNELIPRPQITKEMSAYLKTELTDITESVLGMEQKSLSDKITSFLDKTIFEF